MSDHYFGMCCYPALRANNGEMLAPREEQVGAHCKEPATHYPAANTWCHPHSAGAHTPVICAAFIPMCFEHAKKTQAMTRNNYYVMSQKLSMAGVMPLDLSTTQSNPIEIAQFHSSSKKELGGEALPTGPRKLDPVQAQPKRLPMIPDGKIKTFPATTPMSLKLDENGNEEKVGQADSQADSQGLSDPLQGVHGWPPKPEEEGRKEDG